MLDAALASHRRRAICASASSRVVAVAARSRMLDINDLRRVEPREITIEGGAHVEPDQS